MKILNTIFKILFISLILFSCGGGGGGDKGQDSLNLSPGETLTQDWKCEGEIREVKCNKESHEGFFYSEGPERSATIRVIQTADGCELKTIGRSEFFIDTGRDLECELKGDTVNLKQQYRFGYSMEGMEGSCVRTADTTVKLKLANENKELNGESKYVSDLTDNCPEEDFETHFECEATYDINCNVVERDFSLEKPLFPDGSVDGTPNIDFKGYWRCEYTREASDCTNIFTYDAELTRESYSEVMRVDTLDENNCSVDILDGYIRYQSSVNESEGVYGVCRFGDEEMILEVDRIVTIGSDEMLVEPETCDVTQHLLTRMEFSSDQETLEGRIVGDTVLDDECAGRVIGEKNLEECTEAYRVTCQKNDQSQIDQDEDGVLNEYDNCPSMPNERQEDYNDDGVGDACDEGIDVDGDGIEIRDDNCPNIENPDQQDSDYDYSGDACDDDTDGDNVKNIVDNCPLERNPEQRDHDADGIGDECDDDEDNDGVLDEDDNCPDIPNPDQRNSDSFGEGDACDDDIDGDGRRNDEDNCPRVRNWGQEDSDGDGVGDECDNAGPAEMQCFGDADCPPLLGLRRRCISHSCIVVALVQQCNLISDCLPGYLCLNGHCMPPLGR